MALPRINAANLSASDLLQLAKLAQEAATRLAQEAKAKGFANDQQEDDHAALWWEFEKAKTVAARLAAA